ncbi:peptide deformylase [Clostridiaceae bacterium M8S5]|nr:peptide deformylase [Clostridiaceae bacterium M8S5]
MALRQLRFEGDPILRKKSREVTKIDKRILLLLEDMAETMRKEEGAGLAAPQIGVLKRMATVVIDDNILKLINPVILHQEGEEIDYEACLSVPNRSEQVKRPSKVKVKYKDINGNEQIIDAEGWNARLLCHEIDHLDGILYIDKSIKG